MFIYIINHFKGVRSTKQSLASGLVSLVIDHWTDGYILSAYFASHKIYFSKRAVRWGLWRNQEIKLDLHHLTQVLDKLSQTDGNWMIFSNGSQLAWLSW